MAKITNSFSGIASHNPAFVTASGWTGTRRQRAGGNAGRLPAVVLKILKKSIHVFFNLQRRGACPGSSPGQALHGTQAVEIQGF